MRSKPRLLLMYASRSLVAMVDGLGEVETVTARITEVLGARGLGDS